MFFKIFTALIFFIMLSATAKPAFASTGGSIRVFVDQQELMFNSPPIIIRERVFVPMRAIFETLGASVEWLPENQSIIARHRGRTVIFRIMSMLVDNNGRLEQIDASPRIIRGRTFVPIRFVSQALGADVEWNADTRMVHITRSTAAIPPPLTTPARVLSVVNSNTITVDIEGKTETVRLIGVGIPQRERPNRADIPFGPENLGFIKETIENEPVWLQFDMFKGRDANGDLFAFVWTQRPRDGSPETIRAQVLNLILLARGYAVYDFETSGLLYMGKLIRAEREAKMAGINIWSEYSPDPVHNRILMVLSINHTAEYILLKNNNTLDIDISGWTIFSANFSERFVFPQGTVIPVGESFKVTSGVNAHTQNGRFVWTTENVWGDGGAQARIYNTEGLQAGGLISVGW